MSSEDATKRLSSKKQTLDDAYAAPANFLEIDVINPITHGIGNKRYTDYEVRMKVNQIALIIYKSLLLLFNVDSSYFFVVGYLEISLDNGIGIKFISM